MILCEIDQCQQKIESESERIWNIDDTILLKLNNLSQKWGWNASGKKMLVVSYFHSHNNESACSYFHASKHLRWGKYEITKYNSLYLINI